MLLGLQLLISGRHGGNAASPAEWQWVQNAGPPLYHALQTTAPVNWIWSPQSHTVPDFSPPWDCQLLLIKVLWIMHSGHQNWNYVFAEGFELVILSCTKNSSSCSDAWSKVVGHRGCDTGQVTEFGQDHRACDVWQPNQSKWYSIPQQLSETSLLHNIPSIYFHLLFLK